MKDFPNIDPYCEIPPDPVQVPRGKRKLSKRTVAAAVMILLLIPVTIFIGVYYLGGRKYYFIALAIPFIFYTTLVYAIDPFRLTGGT